jgi:hypothetical protein
LFDDGPLFRFGYIDKAGAHRRSIARQQHDAATVGIWLHRQIRAVVARAVQVAVTDESRDAGLSLNRQWIDTGDCPTQIQTAAQQQ